MHIKMTHLGPKNSFYVCAIIYGELRTIYHASLDTGCLLSQGSYIIGVFFVCRASSAGNGSGKQETAAKTTQEERRIVQRALAAIREGESVKHKCQLHM